MDNSHVPKFGNWDSNDNIPYTAYFESARKGKTGLRMNPNDPEENPEAFMRSPGDCHEVYADVRSVKTASTHNNSQTLASPENPHDIRHNDRRPPSLGSSSDNYKSIVSDISSGSRQSYLDRSPPHSTRSSVRKYKKKSMADGGTDSSSFSPSVSTHRRQHSGSQFSYDYMPMHHQRPTSVPKFGDWDETNAKSGEGFTLIFSKVKEEKEIASSTLPAIPPQVGTYHNFPSKQARGSSLKMKFCCLFPTAME